MSLFLLFDDSRIQGVPPITISTLLAVTHNTIPFVSIYETTGYTKLNNPSSLPAGNGRVAVFNPAGTLLAVGCATTPFIKVYNVTNTTDPSTWTTVGYASGGAGIGFITYNVPGYTKVADPGTTITVSITSCAVDKSSTLSAYGRNVATAPTNYIYAFPNGAQTTTFTAAGVVRSQAFN